MCEVPAYRRVGPVARGQHAISRLSKPAAAVQSATSIKGRLGERGGQQAESHRAAASAPALATGTESRTTSTQRPTRALSAMASLTSISSWPSANVG